MKPTREEMRIPMYMNLGTRASHSCHLTHSSGFLLLYVCILIATILQHLMRILQRHARNVGSYDYQNNMLLTRWLGLGIKMGFNLLSDELW